MNVNTDIVLYLFESLNLGLTLYAALLQVDLPRMGRIYGASFKTLFIVVNSKTLLDATGEYFFLCLIIREM